MNSAMLVILLLVVATLTSATDDNERDARLFAYYSTTSVTKLTTVTITGLSTCLSTKTGNCLGRKRRAFLPQAPELGGLEDPDFDLGSSMEEKEKFEAEVRQERSVKDGERERRNLTIWSTEYTTITLTTTSILPSVTVTASALCIVSGLSASCFS